MPYELDEEEGVLDPHQTWKRMDGRQIEISRS
jgi:hypothetical protein